jgi:hypothetical protein
MGNDNAWGWSGETSVSFSKTRAAATMALVYKDKTYYMFIDGEQVFKWSETAVYDGWGAKIQNMVGTSGTIKVGLANLSSDATFTDWGYSTDERVISEYVYTPKIVKNPAFVNKANTFGAIVGDSYGTWSLNATETEAKIHGGYVFEGEGVKNGEAYMVQATVNKNNIASEIGFVVSSKYADNDNGTSSKYMLIVYRKNNASKPFYFWGSNLWGDVSMNSGVTAFANGDTMTMTLVYTKNTYYMFFDGVLACSVQEDTKIDGWNPTLKSVVGDGENVRLGLVASNKETTFTNWSYSTDTKLIAEYVK